ncbi:hypothetical protein [Halobacillus litoralis]|uniref:hypothetical protein n=1 Tax=Halobacillus litoralis TaxID=45668 RepID=UPI001CFD9DA5|nr:hypothetical protein [Halobacillus litoralis]
MTDDKVKGISSRAKLKREREREKGFDVPDEEVFEDRLANLRYNRTMANIPGGYTVANGMPDVMEGVDSGTTSLEGIAQIWLITDGLFHPDLSIEDTCRRLNEFGMKSYIEDLTYDLQAREMPIDDCTVICVDFIE